MITPLEVGFPEKEWPLRDYWFDWIAVKLHIMPETKSVEPTKVSWKTRPSQETV